MPALVAEIMGRVILTELSGAGCVPLHTAVHTPSVCQR